MSGFHRGAAGNPVRAGRKAARRAMAFLAVATVAMALLAIGIYLIFSGTDLERWGATCLIALLFVARAFARSSREPAYLRWLMPAWLLAAAWNVVSAFAHQRKWPPSQLHVLDLAGYGAGAVTAVLIGVALVVLIRSGGFRRRRPPASQVTPPP